MDAAYLTQGMGTPRRVPEAPGREAFEAALAAGQAKLESLYRMAPIGIGRNVNRVIQEVNPAFCQMLGYSAEELLRAPATDLRGGAPEGKPGPAPTGPAACAPAGGTR